MEDRYRGSFDSKKDGEGGEGSRVARGSDKLVSAEYSRTDSVKLNCSLSASIVGHPTFNDEFSPRTRRKEIVRFTRNESF